MKNFFKILVVLIIFTSSINAQEGHEGQYRQEYENESTE